MSSLQLIVRAPVFGRPPAADFPKRCIYAENEVARQRTPADAADEPTDGGGDESAAHALLVLLRLPAAAAGQGMSRPADLDFAALSCW